MKFQKIEITQSDILLQYANPGLSISIDGIAKWILYNFEHPKWDYTEYIYIIDILLSYLNPTDTLDKIEIWELSFQYFWLKKIKLFGDFPTKSIGKEQKFMDSLKDRIHIRKLNISTVNGNESIYLNYLSSYCDEFYMSVSETKNLSFRAPKVVNINYNSTINNSGSIDITEITDNSQIMITGNSWLENLNISNMYPVWNKNRILKSLCLVSNIKNIRIEWLMNTLIIDYLQIYNSDIERWFIKNLHINSLEWDNIEIKDTYFSNIVFPSKSSNFRVRSFRLVNSIFSNINWGAYFSESYSSSDGKTNFRIEDWEMKELYRTFKYSHDQIWNKTEANKFFAKEMEYYRKSLTKNNRLKTFFDLDIGEKRVICWYNQFTNNFWNSWIRPIIVMILIVWIATLYEFLNFSGSFDWNANILSNILPISEIWKFTSWYGFLYQITWAALIYQFIVALRRISQR